MSNLENQEITISATGPVWIDMTNGPVIGSGDDLITYVNNNKFKVINAEDFVGAFKFWNHRDHRYYETAV